VADPRLFGRELDRAETAVTVTVRDGRTVLGDGPATDADAALSRINVIECADLDTALASARDRVAPGPRDTPYLLLAWVGTATSALAADRGVIAEVEAWRRDVDARGAYVMGSSLGGVEAAETQRLRDPGTIAADSPFNVVDGQLVVIEVVLVADRRHALELAAAHPLARDHTVEVRPFRSTD
jgi:hypothetical protein